MTGYRPPYQVTPEIVTLLTQISEALGELKSLRASKPNPTLRRQNSIRTIQASLAIEGNTLSLEQVSDVLDGKRILGKPEEVREVKNAIACYRMLERFDYRSLKSFLSAHGLLMEGLLPKPGRLRTGAVGILKGSKVAHVAPPAARIPELMAKLFDYLKSSKDPVLLKSSVFHYELEFIHPFDDGNGRMGRLWQTLILMSAFPVFEFIPVESLVHRHQGEYYARLETCDRAGESTEFVEWMLKMILSALVEFTETFRPEVDSASTRMERAREVFAREAFNRSDYLKLHKQISAPTASRDLAGAVKARKLTRTGDQRTTRYRFLK